MNLDNLKLPNTGQEVPIILQFEFKAQTIDTLAGSFAPQVTDAIVLETGFSYSGNFSLSKLSDEEMLFSIIWQVNHPTASPLIGASFGPFIQRAFDRYVTAIISTLGFVAL